MAGKSFEPDVWDLFSALLLVLWGGFVVLTGGGHGNMPLIFNSALEFWQFFEKRKVVSIP